MGVRGGAVSRIVGLPIFSNSIENVTVPAATESFFMVSVIFDFVLFCCTPVSNVLINLIKLNH